MRIVTLLWISSVVILTGCASTAQYETEINNLRGQLTQTQAALAAQEQKNKELEAQLGVGRTAVPIESYQGATYRTPSGFEVPAMDIQKALKAAGYYSGAVDGKLGPDSREALRNFQRDNGLTPDGVCGRQTWNKLKTYLT